MQRTIKKAARDKTHCFSLARVYPIYEPRDGDGYWSIRWVAITSVVKLRPSPCSEKRYSTHCLACALAVERWAERDPLPLLPALLMRNVCTHGVYTCIDLHVPVTTHYQFGTLCRRMQCTHSLATTLSHTHTHTHTHMHTHTRAHTHTHTHTYPYTHTLTHTHMHTHSHHPYANQDLMMNRAAA